MDFQIFSAYFSAIASKVIFRHVAHSSLEVFFLFFHPFLTLITLSMLHGQFTLPCKNSTTNMTKYPGKLGPQRYTLCAIDVPSPPLKTGPIPAEAKLLTQQMPHRPTCSKFHLLPPTFNNTPSSALSVLVHHNHSGLGSMSKSINSSMRSFTIHVSLSMVITEFSVTVHPHQTT